MEPSQLPYDEWIRNALRAVMRQALKHAAEHGLPGDHHFYITFRTGDGGVPLPAELRARYPSEMTIVLQHQFWDLAVEDDGFSVTLKFFGVARNLQIPFDTVTGFVDPAINFAIQLQNQPDEPSSLNVGEPLPAGDRGPGTPGSPSAGENLAKGDVITLDFFRKNKT